MHEALTGGRFQRASEAEQGQSGAFPSVWSGREGERVRERVGGAFKSSGGGVCKASPSSEKWPAAAPGAALNSCASGRGGGADERARLIFEFCFDFPKQV